MDISRSNDTVLIRNKMRINRMFFSLLSDFFLLSYSMIFRGARTFGIDSRLDLLAVLKSTRQFNRKRQACFRYSIVFGDHEVV